MIKKEQSACDAHTRTNTICHYHCHQTNILHLYQHILYYLYPLPPRYQDEAQNPAAAIVATHVGFDLSPPSFVALLSPKTVVPNLRACVVETTATSNDGGKLYWMVQERSSASSSTAATSPSTGALLTAIGGASGSGTGLSGSVAVSKGVEIKILTAAGVLKSERSYVEESLNPGFYHIQCV